jgi:hypothetical protein
MSLSSMEKYGSAANERIRWSAYNNFQQKDAPLLKGSSICSPQQYKVPAIGCDLWNPPSSLNYTPNLNTSQEICSNLFRD